VGTEMTTFPATDDVLVCDMSSDIFSRPMDFNQFDLIYAGAQKNLGPAGTTLVAVRKSILGKTGRSIPSMLDYLVHADKESMFNTPPVFAIYTSLLTLRWIKSEGGLEAMASRANARASMLYAEIDRNPLFRGTARKDSRSLMNACFLLVDESKGAAFEQLAADAGIIGIKGHRSVGGYRASMYNALQLDSVKALVAVMQKLEQQA
ncbi:MAG: 3-phosphoserine/phosphohydroxythreonine transaminase, partial [Schleiferiaceae bacterium]|nr:3-phosphoserine/phosphohydroxythreonine transaminase [Schleiferiaceae bacterium]